MAKRQWIGLTGGIGSGKSTVARMLVGHGAALVDADAISRNITAAGGAAIPLLDNQFGAQVITAEGAMDRDAMRALVFGNPAARKQLEAIVHPLVGIEAARQAEAAQLAGRKFIVFDIPLLVESGHWRQQLDQVLVVDCSESTQLTRVMEREQVGESGRSGWAPDTVKKVIAGQASRAERLSAADACIYNEGLSLEELGLAVKQVCRRFGL
jgi:dephospho-CoA kinase